MHNRKNVNPIGILVLGFALLQSGCAQNTIKAAYRQTVTTMIGVEADPPAQVSIGERIVGITPVTFPYNYEEEVDRNVKHVTYWESNPGWAAFLTVVSFGAYLPFSAIPAEETSQSRPSGQFVGNSVILRLTADGHEPLDHVFELKGEKQVQLKLSLKPMKQKEESR